MLVQFFHIAVAGFNIFVSYWMGENVVKMNEGLVLEPAVKVMRRYSLRYLTNWTFTIQTIYFITCIIYDLLQAFTRAERLKDTIRRYKTYLFTVLAGPAAMLVSIIFWGVWAVDRDLIFPKFMDAVLPPWVNHALHTTTSLFVIGEMVLCYHRFPEFKQGLKGITIYLGVYNICLVGTYAESGIWLYPFLKDLTWTVRILFFIGVYGLAVSLFCINKYASNLMWDEKIQKSTKRQKKKH